MILAHVWPSIGPSAVWDLELGVWIIFAAAADSWAASRKDSATQAQRRRRNGR